MRQIASTLALTFALHQSLLFVVASAQSAPIPAALREMADTERAFVRRAQEVGAKQAFLDYFADDAVGFDGEHALPAKSQIRRQPDPPKDVKVLFWWEPRYGDVAASGDLGWLTGPVRSARNDGPVRHGNYASIWKRQPDGTFKVIIDVGIDPTAEVPFPDGFTRAPYAERYTGGEIAPLARASLLAADRALLTALTSSPRAAYGAVLAPAARVHRNGRLPFAGRDAALAWLETQPPLASGEAQFAEVAQSGDLGYTWGTYAAAAGSDGKSEAGHYVRVWVRDGSGAWRVSLDLTQPRRPGS